ncbi:MAG TPA: FtsX-like permease family protein [Candidatus Ornithoclostridium faecavium]|nr:FtsX-like permease family protein [Candidatus Ornithoclostridium faecavium]
MKKIKKFLSSKSGNVIIAGGEKDVTAYKKAAKIDDSGAKESFRDTTEEDVPAKAYTAEDGKLIRSKLPARHAFKIGASSLKVKPFRLFFTIFLSFIAFAMFGLFSTLTFYDKTSTTVTTYKQSGYEYMYMAKKYNSTTTYYSYGKEDGYYSSSNATRFTPADLASAREKYGTVYGAYNYSLDKYSEGQGFSIGNTKMLRSSYYSTDIKMFVEVTGDSTDFELLTDTDLGALGKNDVVISSYLFESIQKAGLYNGYVPSDGYVTLASYDDIIGKTLAVTDNYTSAIVPLTVRGVYKAAPPEKYDTIKEGTEPADSNLSAQFSKLIPSGMYNMALVSPEFYDAHIALSRSSASYVDTSRFSLKDSLYLKYYESQTLTDFASFRTIAPFSAFPVIRESVVFFKEGQTTLGKNEILISFNDFHLNVMHEVISHSTKLFEEAYKEEYDKAIAVYREKYADEIASYREEQYQQYLYQGYSPETAAQYADNDAKTHVETLAMNDDPDFISKINIAANAVSEKFVQKVNACISIIESGRYDKNGISFSATTDEVNEAIDFLLQYFDADSLMSKQLGIYNQSGASTGIEGLKCAGFVHSGSTYVSMIYADDEVYSTIYSEYADSSSNSADNENYSVERTDFVETADAKCNYFVLPFPEDKAMTALVNDEYIVADDDSFFKLASPVSEQLSFVNQLIDSLEKVFLWVGIVMALFSMLLLFNFISVSISNKKKEIGILRAVGARSADVFKIFYAESAIITIICYVLAMIACLVICPILNTQIAATLSVSIFVFGPVSWLIMLAIALVTSIIATFLPVYSIARKKPVESIRAL